MAHAIRISDEIVDLAKILSKVENRSVGGQIEYWAKIGKIAEENPDFNFSMIRDLLIAIEEAKSGELEEYAFGEGA